MVWKVIAGMGVVCSLVLGLLQLDGRYAKQDLMAQEIERLETQAVQTFEKFQFEMDVRQYDMMQDTVKRDYETCIEMQKSCPDNEEIRNRCERYRREIERLREKKLDLIGG